MTQETTVVVSGGSFASGLTVSTAIPGAALGTPANVTATSFSVPVTVPAGTAAGRYSVKVTNPDNGAGFGTIKVTQVRAVSRGFPGPARAMAQGVGVRPAAGPPPAW